MIQNQLMMFLRAYSLVHALVLCTSDCCTGAGHICCCGSSAHQSQGLYHQMKQGLMIWDAQHIHRRLMTMLSQSAATIRSECHYIKHPDVLALLLCTSERCTWTGHICCGCNRLLFCAADCCGVHLQLLLQSKQRLAACTGFACFDREGCSTSKHLSSCASSLLPCLTK